MMAMYTLRVREEFDAAHRVAGYPGKCDRLHGHTWKVEAAVAGDALDELGMVIDFKRLKGVLKEVLTKYDHHFLNDLPEFDGQNPTAENLARHIYTSLKAVLAAEGLVKSVTVWESPGASVTYEEER